MREPEEDPNIERVECPMCHRGVPLKETLVVGTRRLCSGCASQWFWDEDDEDDKDVKE
jgi:hypothetical protein